jgi:hypothetical protein
VLGAAMIAIDLGGWHTGDLSGMSEVGKFTQESLNFTVQIFQLLYKKVAGNCIA